MKRHLRNSVIEKSAPELNKHTVGELLNTGDILRLCRRHDRLLIPSLPGEVNSSLLRNVAQLWAKGSVYTGAEDILYVKVMPGLRFF